MVQNVHTRKALKAYGLTLPSLMRHPEPPHSEEPTRMRVAVAPRYLTWLQKQYVAKPWPLAPGESINGMVMPNGVTLTLCEAEHVGRWPVHTYIMTREWDGITGANEYLIRKVGEREARDGFVPWGDLNEGLHPADFLDVVHYVSDRGRRHEIDLNVLNRDWCIFRIDSVEHQFEFKMRFNL